jgi:Putative peptidoglycan binding domain/L,D-transpeptidase catalytic domain
VRSAAVFVAGLVLAPAASASPFALELRAPAAATYGEQVVLRGRITPPLLAAPVTVLRDGAPVASATTDATGGFAVRVRAESPATYSAVAGELASATIALAVRPKVRARIVGSGVVGQRLRLEVRVEPAGPVQVEVRRRGRVTFTQSFVGSARVGLSTRRAASFRIRVVAPGGTGWAPAVRVLRTAAVQPRLALGSRGASVRALESRLRELRYALPNVDGLFGRETYEAVLAFQKLSGLPWTGRVDARLWRALAHARAPRARYAGDHIEVSKGRQVLLLVRGGKVERAVHVSTGATGNTPIGRWRVYRKVTGWDWILWYPMYFLRGFAIHGYPSVPAYPASHGCVRVPMWIAPQLWAGTRYGQTIFVYW